MVAVKVNTQLSDRTVVDNVIMQGTSWGTPSCTTSMDDLAVKAYEDPKLLYKYKGEVAIPPLMMVDDVLTVSKCQTDSVIMNSTVNAFMSTKKLKLSTKKCNMIHIQKDSVDRSCPNLKVNGKTMNKSIKEKYLGDFITESASIKETIKDRVNKANGSINEIVSILQDVPLGSAKTNIGLKLRNAMFASKILVNCESWQSILKTDMKDMELADNRLMRKILNSHAKTPTEMLFLETAEIPLKFLVMSRRLNFLHSILKRDDSELVKRVLKKQMESRTKGEWFDTVLTDFSIINEVFEEDVITARTKDQHKIWVKKAIKKVAFKELLDAKDGHSKVQNIEYDKFEIQPYLVHPSFSSKQSSQLFKLRTKTENFRANFSSQFGGDVDRLKCQLNCEDTHAKDSQEHILTCSRLQHMLSEDDKCVEYSHIFGNIEKQKNATVLFMKLIEERDNILDDAQKNS